MPSREPGLASSPPRMARKAFRLAKEEPVGVILLDGMMPEMSGIEALRFLGEREAGITHEIRDPLFGISSVAQILVREVNINHAH